MTITSIERHNHASISQLLVKALADFETQHGVKITANGGTLSGGRTGTFKLEMSIVDASGEIETTGSRNFKHFAAHYGLKAEDFGKEFISGRGERFKITGISPSRPKFPIDGVRVHDGKQFKFPAGSVISGLRTIGVAPGFRRFAA